jgi:hypothetical protein
LAPDPRRRNAPASNLTPAREDREMHQSPCALNLGLAQWHLLSAIELATPEEREGIAEAFYRMLYDALSPDPEPVTVEETARDHV